VRFLLSSLVAALLGLLIAGCATPGPLHVYTLAADGSAAIRDTGDAGAEVELRSFIEPGERLTGFAYDPFTDHFFLRLAPGNRIRVVDRPARAIKRELALDAAPADGGGDLAVKPRSGHLFLLCALKPEVIEFSRLGGFVRTFALADLSAPPIGIAYDAAQDRLLVASHDPAGRVEISRYDFTGRRLGHFTLERDIGPSLAFDAEKRELYAPLAQEPAIGVFDETGKLVRTVPTPARFIDVGPRSFIRVF
jgi:hypothetical protein